MPELDDYLATSDLEAITALTTQLIEHENHTGAEPVLQPAVLLLDQVRERINRGSVDPTVLADACSIAGELAEVAGFFAWDADQLELAHSLNLEALHFARLASDTSIELLTLQNMSMAATTACRPAESHLIAQSVLESDRPISTRVRCMFTIRKARALALGGDWAAIPAFERAHELWSEGPSDLDPPWCWWLDTREMAWQRAMIHRDLRVHRVAIEGCEHAVEATLPHETKKIFAHQVDLLRSQAEAGAYSDLKATVENLTPLKTVRSARALVTLREAIEATPEHLEPVAAQLALLARP